MRQSSLIILMLAIFAVNQISAKAANAPVEVIEIKEIGISDKDETKSVIEIRWRINPTLITDVRSFKILLSVTYADGTTKNVTRYTNEESDSVQIEVPSVSFSTRKTAAFIKNLNALVIAEPIKKTI